MIKLSSKFFLQVIERIIKMKHLYFYIILTFYKENLIHLSNEQLQSIHWDTISAGVVVGRLNDMYVHMCWHISRCEYMYVFMYVPVGVYMCMVLSWPYVCITRTCIYVYVNIGSETYLCGWPYVFCAGTTNQTRVLVEMVR